jgi:hypothetical protein
MHKTTILITSYLLAQLPGESGYAAIIEKSILGFLCALLIAADFKRRSEARKDMTEIRDMVRRLHKSVEFLTTVNAVEILRRPEVKERLREEDQKVREFAQKILDDKRALL